MKIAVAGGTGVVGAHAVDAAIRRGRDVVVLTRSGGVDLTTGEGLAASLTGVDAVIDVTNTSTLSASAAVGFFERVTKNLLTAEEAAGVTHHVVLSIVGIDTVNAGYYAGKNAHERAVAAGTIGHTIVRATQFHEFATQQLAGMRGPIAVLPRLLMRPVAAREVGEYLVTVAEGSPQKRAADLVGPRDEVLADLARRQLAYDGVRRRIVEIRLPGAFGRAMSSGVLRGTANHVVGTITFDEWLASGDHSAPAATPKQR